MAITRDNVGTNNNILELFSKRARAMQDKMNDLDWARFSLQFNTVKGDNNFITHVYNIAVQAGTTAIIAEPNGLRYTNKRDSNREILPQERESPSRFSTLLHAILDTQLQT